MSLVLDLVYLGVLTALSPWLLWKSWQTGKYREGWSEKFLGRAPRRIADRPCLWFHAVSVGEVLLLRPLVAEMQRRRPHWDVVISTTTQTGLAVARRTFPDVVTFFAPLDFSWSTRRALSRVRPTVLALVELELWPNWIRTARRMGARVAVINGRLSERSHRGYRRIRPFLAGTLDCLDLVAVQDQEYAKRFIDIGVNPSRIRITGSIKYDGLESDRDNPRTLTLRRELGLRPTDVVFVAGSTMEGEEEAALAAYQSASAECPKLRLILVPRHLERADRIARWLESHGVSYVRRSRAKGEAGNSDGGRSPNPPVLLVDTLGELEAVWGLADIAFVGGSLLPGRNGQNMMEPAAYGATVLFGPYTSNFREAVEGLLARNGAHRILNAADLTRAVKDALDDPESAARLGSSGRQYVLAQNGAASRTLAELEILIPKAPQRTTALISS